MNDQQWKQAYLNAQAMTESKLGQLSLNPTQINIINTWIRYALTMGTAPDISSIYFGVYDDLPPEGFGAPKSVKAFIARAHEVQGLPELSQIESDQIDALSVLTYTACKSMLS